MIQTMVNDVGYCDVKRISTERIESLLRSGRIEECREVVNGFSMISSSMNFNR